MWQQWIAIWNCLSIESFGQKNSFKWLLKPFSTGRIDNILSHHYGGGGYGGDGWTRALLPQWQLISCVWQLSSLHPFFWLWDLIIIINKTLPELWFPNLSCLAIPTTHFFSFTGLSTNSLPSRGCAQDPEWVPRALFFLPAALLSSLIFHWEYGGVEHPPSSECGPSPFLALLLFP